MKTQSFSRCTRQPFTELSLNRIRTVVCPQRPTICQGPLPCSAGVGPAKARSSSHVVHSSEQQQPATSTSTASGDAVAFSALLESPQQRSLAFSFFSASSAALGALALAAPGLLLQVALPGAPMSSLDEPFVRIAGATMIISCAVEYCLKDAADNNRLTSTTYQKLLLGCAVKSAGYLIAFAQASSLWNPVLSISYPTIAAASMVTGALVLSQVQAAVAASVSNNGSGSGGSSLVDLLPQWPKTTAGKVYTLFSVLYLLTAALCYGPEAVYVTQQASAATGGAAAAAVVTDVSLLLKHTWAPGFWLAAVACLVLQDAADRGRLSGGTFRRLNLGLAGLEAAYTAILLPAMLSGAAVSDATGWSNLAGSAGISVYCAYQYFTNAKKK